MPSRSLSLLVVGAFLGGLGCGAREPPRHPMVTLSERVTAKVDLISLVVADPARAERVRALYLRAAAVLRDYEAERKRSVATLRGTWKARALAAPPPTPTPTAPGSELFESLLAPPIDEGKSTFERYARLMLEARGLLTEREFERLDRVR